ncbi:MAG TPA: carbohydrate-binding family 9-like protein [Puia sp.]|jgi:hypothetical protein
MYKSRFLWLLFCLMNSYQSESQSFPNQTADSPVLTVNHTKDFSISGDGTADSWKTEKWINLPMREGKGPAYETKMKILYSDSGIYCLYYCQDLVLTTTLKKDFSDLYNEDVVEAFFWPDENTPVYFEYEVSPNNYELPLLVPNINGNYMGWLPNHYVGNRKTRHLTHVIKQADKMIAWTAEFFIPYELFKPLIKTVPSTNTRWRANFYRIDYDHGGAGWAWRSTRKDFHDYEHFGTLNFK